MDRQAQIDRILDHYENPRNYGALADATLVRQARNPGCGDLVTVYLRLAGGRIEEITFEGEGCTISQAAASMTSDLLTGQTLEHFEEIAAEELVAMMGREIAATRWKCVSLALSATKEAVRSYQDGPTTDGSVTILGQPGRLEGTT